MTSHHLYLKQLTATFLLIGCASHRPRTEDSRPHVCTRAMYTLSTCEEVWPTIDNRRFEERHGGNTYEKECMSRTSDDPDPLGYYDPYDSPTCIVRALSCRQVAQCPLYPEYPKLRSGSVRFLRVGANAHD